MTISFVPIQVSDVEVSHRGAIEILHDVGEKDFNAYETRVERALLQGEVPTWMMTFHEFSVDYVEPNVFTKHVMTFKILRDYLTIGTDEEHLRVPLSPVVAQRIADKWNCVLPTTKMVNLAWTKCFQRFMPEPWGPPYDHDAMASLSRIREHDKKVELQFQQKKFDRFKPVAGHKKDVVLTNALRIKPQQVAIYGWHYPDGKRIQELYLGHGNWYYDYSHGIRMWSRECVVDGEQRDLVDLLQDFNFSKQLTDEGKMIIVKQP